MVPVSGVIAADFFFVHSPVCDGRVGDYVCEFDDHGCVCVAVVVALFAVCILIDYEVRHVISRPF